MTLFIEINYAKLSLLFKIYVFLGIIQKFAFSLFYVCHKVDIIMLFCGIWPKTHHGLDLHSDRTLSVGAYFELPVLG